MVLRLFLFVALLLFLGCADTDYNYDNPSDPRNISHPDNITYESFTDSRDGKIYKSVVIGKQVWMAENLNYASGGYCIDNEEYTNSDGEIELGLSLVRSEDANGYCDIYGKLCNWAVAQNQCPSGWHLPSAAEWTTLMNFIGNDVAKLKAKNGWIDNSNGTDDYGFTAVPSGYGIQWNYSSEVFLGSVAYFWSISTYADMNYFRIGNTGTNERMRGDSRTHYSVRCLKDYSSSSSNVGTGSKGNDISSYRTVEIGSQVWMAENLDYNVSDSKCYGDSESNCATYGRLYDWATVMNFPSTCNSSTCASLVQAKHRGICPSGWHIPTRDEWDTLLSYVKSDKGCSSDCEAKHLKATDGWYNNGNGLDSYVFTALPGGKGYPNGKFTDVGFGGYWWSVTESWTNETYSRSMYDDDNYCWGGTDPKAQLLSVRCVQDAASGASSSSSVRSSSSVYSSSIPSSSSAPQSSSSSVQSSSSSSGYVGTGGKGNNISSYNTVPIGSQVWMAENLNYDVEGSKCYNNLESNCDTYGRLYDWATAMDLPASCNSSTCASQVSAKHRGICPEYWHIPSDDEWNELANAVGGLSTAGTYLKATDGWYSYYGNSGNGLDSYGFSALPGGYRTDDGNFYNYGSNTIFWSATEYGANGARSRVLHYNYETMDWYNGNKSDMFSVRCVRD